MVRTNKILYFSISKIRHNQIVKKDANSDLSRSVKRPTLRRSQITNQSYKTNPRSENDLSSRHIFIIILPVPKSNEHSTLILHLAASLCETLLKTNLSDNTFIL